MDFGYFHEEESEQCAFYRIPQVLFKDEKFAKLSTDAKVLYGLFLNRVFLSKKNHWIDDEGRVYVYYTLVSIQEDLHKEITLYVSYKLYYLKMYNFNLLTNNISL